MEIQISSLPEYTYVEDYYYITEEGYIVSYAKNGRRVLKSHINKSGYKINNITIKKGTGKKTFILHRIVAYAFLPKNIEHIEVNHIDGNKLNNNISNLEWVTKKENIEHSWNIGLRDNSWAKGSKNYQWKGNHKNCRSIVQKDKNGNVINKYNSIAIAARENPNLKRHRIDQALAKEDNYYEGFLWEYND
ncbi:DNA repair exonuclease [Staphylococcus phage vB_SsapH-Golestan101-M]|nr:DNA repair exonuclease [Staphylococcus phage vB_SsapH-Golestan101-M]